jgi:ABC-type nitrate/sulfonate/bicarbonate transport system ATPase subunit
MLRLEVERLVVRRSDAVIVSNFNLSATTGEVIVFMGPSWTGKTSVLECLVDGHETSKSVRWLQDQRLLSATPAIGLMQQSSSGMPDWMSAGQYIRMCASAWKTPWREVQDTARNLFASLCLDWDADNHKTRSQLSGGMLARVSLAGALVARTQVLVLDEPFASVDSLLRYKLLNALKARLESRDAITLIVTHSPLEAFFLADRIVFFVDAKSGKLIEHRVERSTSPDSFTFDMNERSRFMEIFRDIFTEMHVHSRTA